VENQQTTTPKKQESKKQRQLTEQQIEKEKQDSIHKTEAKR
jgi:hypothetical protein